MRRITLLWIASLVATALLASGLTQAQVQIPRFSQQDPRILSGGDFGFRVDGYDRGGRPQGTVMVRQNGEWVEATFSIAVRRVH